jgi:UDP-glucose 4-epimerase
VFNIGADQPYTILKLAEEVANAFGTACRVLHLPARNEVVDAFSDHTKIRSVFDAVTPVDLATGIRRMAEWVKQRGPTQPASFGKLELEKNLPPSWKAQPE